MIVKSATSLQGSISMPGDKSISHRAVIVASLAEGESRIENFSTGADCESTIQCLRQLGAGIDREGTLVRVKGVGKTGFRKPTEPLDCRNSGTTMRLLAGVLAGQDFGSVLTGDESLKRRPMDRIIDPLAEMGAVIESENGFAPLKITSKNPLKAIRYEMPVASAQVKSCVLLAGMNADGGTTVIENTRTRDHTELMLRWFGADVTVFDKELGEGDLPDRIQILGDSVLMARNIEVPGDISSAAFFIAAAACLEGSNLEISNVGINPTRSDILAKLINFGADIDILEMRNTQYEPSADIVVRGQRALKRTSKSNVIKGKDIAGLIDEIPALAVFGTQVEGGIEIRDAAELRVKESDRIAAIVENLRRMGAAAEEFPDGFRVERSNLTGAVVDSFGDHRIAMAFAVAGLFADGETEIKNAECASISFPGFYETLASINQ